MQVVSRARAFKRSWVDMAEALCKVRDEGLFQRWGYESLHAYALEELNIKRATCDKLTVSYSAMEQHVPHVLEWDGVAQELPTIDAVDYFARALDPRPRRHGEPPPPPPDDEVVAELRTAIFDDLAGAPALRRRFNEVLHPKSDDEHRRELLGRVRSTADRLESLVGGTGLLADARVEDVARCMEQLREDLDRLAGESP